MVLFLSLPLISPAAGAQAKTGALRDVSEELSRQLEDILSTYCIDNNQGGPGEDGAQGEPGEPEDAEKSRTYASRNGEPEPETPVVNGEKEPSKGEPGADEIRASDEVVDRDHRRPQEKKKAKGLGEQRAAAYEAGEGREFELDIPGLACCARIWRKHYFQSSYIVFVFVFSSVFFIQRVYYIYTCTTIITT